MASERRTGWRESLVFPGSGCRFLSRPNFFVSVADLRYEYGFGFGCLYHPYTQALETGTVFRGATLLAEFYDAMDLWRIELNNWQALPVQAWRFGKSKRVHRLENRIPSTHFGWESGRRPAQARKRVEHLFRLRDSIETKGYQIEASQPIDGVWVGKAFLVLGGQHRVAVLVSLGWEKIRVVNVGRKNTPRKLIAKKLPLVKSEELALDDARHILDRVERGFSVAEASEASFPFSHSGPPRTPDA